MGFHVSHEQTHVLPPPSLQSSCEQIDIMLSVDGIHTLAKVIIVDPTRVDLVSQIASFHGVVATMATQAKEGLYHDRHPTYTFLPLTIKVFVCTC
jgi:hypothetical protein